MAELHVTLMLAIQIEFHKAIDRGFPHIVCTIALFREVLIEGFVPRDFHVTREDLSKLGVSFVRVPLLFLVGVLELGERQGKEELNTEAPITGQNFRTDLATVFKPNLACLSLVGWCPCALLRPEGFSIQVGHDS